MKSKGEKSQQKITNSVPTSKKSRESEFQTVSTKNLCGGVRVCLCQTKIRFRSSRRADLSEENRTVPGIQSHHRRHEFKLKCVYGRCGWFEVLPQITLPQSHGFFCVVRGGSGVSGDRGPLRECGGAFVFGMIYNYIRIIKQNYHTNKKRKQMDKDNLPEKLITTIPRVYCCNCYAESISSCSFPKLIVASYLPPLMCIYAQNQHTLFYSYIPCIFKPPKHCLFAAFQKVTSQTVISMIQIQCD